MSAYFAINGLANSYHPMSDLNLIQKHLGDVSIVDVTDEGIPIINIDTKKFDRNDKVIFKVESRFGDVNVGGINEINGIDVINSELIKFTEEHNCKIINADDIEKFSELWNCWCKVGDGNENGLPILIVGKKK